jgi:hypothetical protein
MKCRWTIVGLLTIFFATSALACDPHCTGTEILFSLLVGVSTISAVPALVVTSVMVCLGRGRTAPVWIVGLIWLFALSVLVGGVMWARVV